MRYILLILFTLLSSTVANFNLGGDHFNCYLNEGKVQCWGRNFNGALGIDSSDYTVEKLTPQDVITSGVVDLDCARLSCCAVKDDGKVYCWGGASRQQLGDGQDTTNKHKPTEVPNVSGIDMIRAGSTNYMARKSSDGSLIMWGENDGGAGGTGTLREWTSSGGYPMESPIAVKDLTNVKDFAVDRASSAAILDNGDVYVWGKGDQAACSSCGYGSKWATPKKVPSGDIREKCDRLFHSADYKSCITTASDGQRVIIWGGWKGFDILTKGGSPSCGNYGPCIASYTDDDKDSGLKANFGPVKTLAMSFHGIYFIKTDGSLWLSGHPNAQNKYSYLNTENQASDEYGGGQKIIAAYQLEDGFGTDNYAVFSAFEQMFVVKNDLRIVCMGKQDYGECATGSKVAYSWQTQRSDPVYSQHLRFSGDNTFHGSPFNPKCGLLQNVLATYTANTFSYTGTSCSSASDCETKCSASSTCQGYGTSPQGYDIVIAAGNGKIIHSSDGSTFSEKTSPMSSSDTPVGSAHGNGNYVITYSSRKVAYSTDGKTWTVLNQIHSDCGSSGCTLCAYNGLIWDGTRFVQISKQGHIFTSTTGATWTKQQQRSIPGNDYHEQQDSIAYDPGTGYYIIGASYDILVHNDLAGTFTKLEGQVGTHNFQKYPQEKKEIVAFGGGRFVTAPRGSGDWLTCKPTAADPCDDYDDWHVIDWANIDYSYSEYGHPGSYKAHCLKYIDGNWVACLERSRFAYARRDWDGDNDKWTTSRIISNSYAQDQDAVTDIIHFNGNYYYTVKSENIIVKVKHPMAYAWHRCNPSYPSWVCNYYTNRLGSSSSWSNVGGKITNPVSSSIDLWYMVGSKESVTQYGYLSGLTGGTNAKSRLKSCGNCTGSNKSPTAPDPLKGVATVCEPPHAEACIANRLPKTYYRSEPTSNPSGACKSYPCLTCSDCPAPATFPNSETLFKDIDVDLSFLDRCECTNTTYNYKCMSSCPSGTFVPIGFGKTPVLRSHGTFSHCVSYTNPRKELIVIDKDHQLGSHSYRNYFGTANKDFFVTTHPFSNSSDASGSARYGEVGVYPINSAVTVYEQLVTHESLSVNTNVEIAFGTHAYLTPKKINNKHYLAMIAAPSEQGTKSKDDLGAYIFSYNGNNWVIEGSGPKLKPPNTDIYFADYGAFARWRHNAFFLFYKHTYSGTSKGEVNFAIVGSLTVNKDGPASITNIDNSYDCVDFHYNPDAGSTSVWKYRVVCLKTVSSSKYEIKLYQLKGDATTYTSETVTVDNGRYAIDGGGTTQDLYHIVSLDTSSLYYVAGNEYVTNCACRHRNKLMKRSIDADGKIGSTATEVYEADYTINEIKTHPEKDDYVALVIHEVQNVKVGRTVVLYKSEVQREHETQHSNPGYLANDYGFDSRRQFIKKERSNAFAKMHTVPAHKPVRLWIEADPDYSSYSNSDIFKTFTELNVMQSKISFGDDNVFFNMRVASNSGTGGVLQNSLQLQHDFPTFCERNEKVVSQVCTSCSSGKFNLAGDIKEGSDTTCHPTCAEDPNDASCVEICGVNEHVKNISSNPPPLFQNLEGVAGKQQLNLTFSERITGYLSNDRSQAKNLFTVKASYTEPGDQALSNKRFRTDQYISSHTTEADAKTACDADTSCVGVQKVGEDVVIPFGSGISFNSLSCNDNKKPGCKGKPYKYDIFARYEVDDNKLRGLYPNGKLSSPFNYHQSHRWKFSDHPAAANCNNDPDCGCFQIGTLGTKDGSFGWEHEDGKYITALYFTGTETSCDVDLDFNKVAANWACLPWMTYCLGANFWLMTKATLTNEINTGGGDWRTGMYTTDYPWTQCSGDSWKCESFGPYTKNKFDKTKWYAMKGTNELYDSTGSSVKLYDGTSSRTTIPVRWIDYRGKNVILQMDNVKIPSSTEKLTDLYTITSISYDDTNYASRSVKDYQGAKLAKLTDQTFPANAGQNTAGCSSGVYPCLACSGCGNTGTNDAGDWAVDGVTTCSVPTETNCAINQYVVGYVCTNCPAGKTNADGASLTNHAVAKSTANNECDITTCAVNQRAVNNVCVACPTGKVSAAGADASTNEDKCASPPPQTTKFYYQTTTDTFAGTACASHVECQGSCDMESTCEGYSFTVSSSTYAFGPKQASSVSGTQSFSKEDSCPVSQHVATYASAPQIYVSDNTKKYAGLGTCATKNDCETACDAAANCTGYSDSTASSLIVGTTQTIYQSGDGFTTTSTYSGGSNTLWKVRGMATDGDIIIAVGGSYGSTQPPVFLTSTDGGVSWTSKDVCSNNCGYMHGIDYVNGIFVATGANAQIYSSSDKGATWTKEVRGSIGSSDYLYNVVHDGTYYWIHNRFGDVHYRTNINVAGTKVSILSGHYFYGFAYGNGRFIMGGPKTSSNKFGKYCDSSCTTASNWNEFTLEITNKINTIVYINDHFVAHCDGDGGDKYARVCFSDGTATGAPSWTCGKTTTSYAFSKLAYSNGKYYAYYDDGVYKFNSLTRTGTGTSATYSDLTRVYTVSKGVDSYILGMFAYDVSGYKYGPAVTGTATSFTKSLNDVCSGIYPCNKCVNCTAGTYRPPPEDVLASGATTCVAAPNCTENQRVQNFACVACPAGSTRPAGDSATGGDTECEVCKENYYVKGRTCTACDSGNTRPAGDNINNGDTKCVVPISGTSTSTSVASKVDKPREIVYLDYDNDGDLDLLIYDNSGTATENGMEIWTNTGSSATPSYSLFLAKSRNTCGAGVNQVKILDWDKDGDLDVFASKYVGTGALHSSDLCLYEGGSAKFTTSHETDKKVSAYTSGVAGRFSFVDYDFDGDLDICGSGRTNGLNCIKNTGQASISAFMDTGEHNFSPSMPCTGCGNRFLAVEATPLFEGGPIVAIAQTFGPINANDKYFLRLWMSDSTTKNFVHKGELTPRPTAFVTDYQFVDLNKDGILDLILTTGKQVNEYIFDVTYTSGGYETKSNAIIDSSHPSVKIISTHATLQLAEAACTADSTCIAVNSVGSTFEVLSGIPAYIESNGNSTKVKKPDVPQLPGTFKSRTISTDCTNSCEHVAVVDLFNNNDPVIITSDSLGTGSTAKVMTIPSRDPADAEVASTTVTKVSTTMGASGGPQSSTFNDVKGGYLNDVLYVVDSNGDTFKMGSDNQMAKITGATYPGSKSGSQQLLTVNGKLTAVDFDGTAMKVYQFDTQSNTWKTITLSGTLPVQKDAAIATDGKNIFVVGGEDGSGNVHKKVTMYNLLTNAATPMADMSVALKDSAVEFHNNKLIIHGGKDSSVSSKTYIYDTNSQTTSSVTGGPQVHSAASVTIGGAMYVQGGYQGASSNLKSETWKFSYSSKTWEQVTLPAGGPAATHSSILGVDANGKLKVFGGGTDSGVASDSFTIALKKSAPTSDVNALTAVIPSVTSSQKISMDPSAFTSSGTTNTVSLMQVPSSTAVAGTVLKSPASCDVNYRAVNGQCEICPPLSTSTGVTDPATTRNTACTPISAVTSCGKDEYVKGGKCYACIPPNTNEAGDNVTKDSECDCVNSWGPCVDGTSKYTGTCIGGQDRTPCDSCAGSWSTCDARGIKTWANTFVPGSVDNCTIKTGETQFCACGKNEYAKDSMCNTCPEGSTSNLNNYDPTQGDTYCLCQGAMSSDGTICSACPVGTTNNLKDHHPKNDGAIACQKITCAANQHVQSHQCVACPFNSQRLAGDDPQGADTKCHCKVNSKVIGGVCKACETGSSNPKLCYANSAEGDVYCTCDKDYRGTANKTCVKCEEGSERAAGWYAGDGVSFCTCKEGYKVNANNACAKCPDNSEVAPGGNPTGAETYCMCKVDFYSDNGECKACPANSYLDIPTYTNVNSVCKCKQGFHVVDDSGTFKCQACTNGDTNAQGDPLSAVTKCNCGANRRKLKGECVACKHGSTRPAGDDPNPKYDTSLSFTSNGNNDFVYNGQNDPEIKVCKGVSITFTRADSGHPLRVVKDTDCTDCNTGTYGSLPTSSLSGWSDVAGSSSGSYTFADAGTHYYLCTSHSSMVGKLVVEECNSNEICQCTGDYTNKNSANDASVLECTACGANQQQKTNGVAFPKTEGVCECKANNYVSSGACVNCPGTSTSVAGGDLSTDLNTCQSLPGYYFSNGGAQHTQCPVGARGGTKVYSGSEFSNKAAPNDQSPCVLEDGYRVTTAGEVELCPADSSAAGGLEFKVGVARTTATACICNKGYQATSQGACALCPTGQTTDGTHKTNEAQRACHCKEGFYVDDNTDSCKQCNQGSSAAEGGDPSGPSTSCDCAANYRVDSSAQCVACNPGETNAPLDKTQDGETQCDVTKCKANERVVSNACVACPTNMVNVAGDLANGQNTPCDYQGTTDKQYEIEPSGSNFIVKRKDGTNPSGNNPTIALRIGQGPFYFSRQSGGSGDDVIIASSITESSTGVYSAYTEIAGHLAKQDESVIKFDPTSPGTYYYVSKSTNTMFGKLEVSLPLATVPTSGTTTLTSSAIMSDEITLTGDLTINVASRRRLSNCGINKKCLKSVGPNTLQAASGKRHFTVPAGKKLTINGITLEGGNPASGAGGSILVEGGTLDVTNVKFKSNSASTGGAIASRQNNAINPKLIIKSSTFESNTGANGAGAVEALHGELTVDQSTFKDNTATTGDGGAIHAETDATITGGTFEGNTASGGKGGAVKMENKELNMQGTTLKNNQAQSGGALLILKGKGILKQLVAESNSADEEGGAILVDQSDVNITNSNLKSNTASTNGGAIKTKGMSGKFLEADDNTFESNTGSAGGGAVHVDDDDNAVIKFFRGLFRNNKGDGNTDNDMSASGLTNVKVRVVDLLDEMKKSGVEMEDCSNINCKHRSGSSGINQSDGSCKCMCDGTSQYEKDSVCTAITTCTGSDVTIVNATRTSDKVCGPRSIADKKKNMDAAGAALSDLVSAKLKEQGLSDADAFNLAVDVVGGVNKC